MLESIVISGNLLLAFTVWIGLLCLMSLTNILIPNWKQHQIALGKKKPSNDNVTRFIGAIWFAVTSYIFLHLTELIK